PTSQNWILACTISTDGQYVAVCDDAKQLHVFQVDQYGCRLISSRCVARRVTSVRFTKDSSHVVVVDRSGDAYSFPAHEQQTADKASTSPAPEAVDDDEASPGGTLILGHLSMALDVLLVADDSLIVTCDRDEKIRISRYPDGYQIESYCLGHTQFIKTLVYDEDLKALISGSGDASVRVWTLDGKELGRVNVLDQLPQDENETDACHTTPQTNSSGDQLTSKQSDRVAVQSLAYCSKCRLLFVSLYRSSNILTYRLVGSGSSISLQFCSIISGTGIVSSIAVSGCVLWLARTEENRLHWSAYRIQDNGDTVQITVVDSDSTEQKMLQTFHNSPELCQAPPSCLDLFPMLWKSGYQEDFKDHWKTKRSSGDTKNHKDKKKQKVEAAAS
ncbi:WD repeat-containing protein 4, partial [Bulinus truncatus]